LVNISHHFQYVEAAEHLHVGAASGVASVVLNANAETDEGRRNSLLSESRLACGEGQLGILEAALGAGKSAWGGRDGGDAEDESGSEGEGDHDEDG
jgi:hypothetical protein